jgi:hypothetical protein
MANANAVRDWRIYADFAQHLIGIARELYIDEALPGLEGLDTVYALDSSTIDLCLSVFSMGAFPFNQSGHQVAYATRSAWQHSVVYLHQRRQNA